MSMQLPRQEAGKAHRYLNEIESVVASIRACESALIAFSGGVDSSVVAKLAEQALGDNAVAVTVDNGALHRGEAEGADEIAKALGIRRLAITLEPLKLLEVKQNDPQRCYYCKRLIFGALRCMADELCLKTVMDGTNASDLERYRPGLKALREIGVVSPLLGLTKDEVRNIARLLNLPNADAPSVACLFTSFPYGTTITSERIERLRGAEDALRAIGILDVKVRDHHDFARIEVNREDAETVVAHSSTLAETFSKLGFTYVTLDLGWLRSGSMDISLNSTNKKSTKAR
jgi:pyridinium-3,5-biscarboxylic acid mononucleotide sulfurtransferase